MINNSLKNRWLILSTLIITVTYIIFSSFLIYFISIYLQDQEYRSVERSLNELESLYSNEGINTIDTNNVYSSLYDGQKMTLYTSSGEAVFNATTGISLSTTADFISVSEQSIEFQEIEGNPYLVGRIPLESIYWNGYLTVIHPLNSYNAIIRTMVFIAIVIGFFSMLFTSIISYFFSSQMVKPIRSIAKQLQKIESNGFGDRLKVNTGSEETEVVVNHFNSMMDSLEASYNQQKQFVEDASHELRTPLQIINGHLNLISRWGKNKPDVLDESLSISIDELRRINRLVEELLLLTKNEELSQYDERLIDISSEVKSRVDSFRKIHGDYQFDVFTNEKIEFMMNPHHLEQILTIFLDNAIKFDQENKHIVIEVKNYNDSFEIYITDHGIGIPNNETESIFNRFYRVDKSRSRLQGGNGLGLSIAKKIIESYKGNVKIDSVEGKFTKVTIRFPLVV